MDERIIDPFIWYGVKDWVEDYMYLRLGLEASLGQSFNMAFPDEKITKREKTTRISQLLSSFFEEGPYLMLKEAGVNVTEKKSSNGDIIINDEPWEIKTTQGDCPTGSTHSAQKPKNYAFIKYKLDRDKIIVSGSNEGIITEFGVWISDSVNNEWWKGKATENNSQTSLNIPIDKSYKINTVIGNLTHGTKYCKLINEVI